MEKVAGTSQFSSLAEAFKQLKSSPAGLSSSDARRRLKKIGPNSVKPPHRTRGLLLLLAQFKSPLILLLTAAALLSFFLSDRIDASLIFVIVLLSGLLGFFQERGALNALEKLLQLVENRALVRRDGKECELSISKLVPGDLVLLRAGDLVPADCLLVAEKHLFVDEAALTGESLPVEKESTETLTPLYLGTTVASGTAEALVIATGPATAYNALFDRIRFRPPETAFEQGVRRFGYFLMEVTLWLVLAIFAFNILVKKPIIDSFLFSLALAVGLTPQLLPAIISVNLSHGARKMAKKHVIVKRLASIENFGQMDILCTDKTGTLTEGKVELKEAVDALGASSKKTFLYAYLNAHFQTGYDNPLDHSLLSLAAPEISGWEKLEEIPYDFVRKRISVLLSHQGKKQLIVKGAVPQILSICDRVELADGRIVPLASLQDDLTRYFEQQSQKGFRTLAVATGEGENAEQLLFLGFLFFYDPLKPGISETLAQLQKLGVSLKILTGDHQAVALHVANQVGLNHGSVITGPELHQISDQALIKIVRQKSIFAQIEPNQKERIILALRRSGHVVGFLGDGVNDVSALHSADVGIAVDASSDAAKEAADIILLKKDLSVLHEGIAEGRTTFGNTLKYVYMATSANFGNMFSMAGTSLFLPFLPLLPKQVLLVNFLSDFPEMALATDRVDAEIVRRPVKWDLPFIRRFMLVFGLLSSIADYMTFGILLYWLGADTTLFRTGWFVESIASAALIALVIRTRGPFWRSRPSPLLLTAVLAVVIGVLFLPYTRLGPLFGLSPMPLSYYPLLLGILSFYILSVEIAKRFFFKKILYRRAEGGH